MIYLANSGEHFLVAATPQTDDPAFRQTQTLMGNLVDMEGKKSAWGGEKRRRAGTGQRRRGQICGGNWKHMQWSGCRSSPSLRYPDNRTQQRREMGQKWCEAECEGDDTWPVTGILWNKDGNQQQRLNKHTRPTCFLICFRSLCSKCVSLMYYSSNT